MWVLGAAGAGILLHTSVKAQSGGPTITSAATPVAAVAPAPVAAEYGNGWVSALPPEQPILAHPYVTEWEHRYSTVFNRPEDWQTSIQNEHGAGIVLPQGTALYDRLRIPDERKQAMARHANVGHEGRLQWHENYIGTVPRNYNAVVNTPMN